MAELIGLIASIVALAETGFKISKSISRIATEFGTAGEQITAIGTDTRAVSLILREIPKRLKRARSVAAEVQNVAADIVALSKSDIEDIEEFLKSLQPLQGSEVSIKQKTKWLFTKSKVSLRRASLDSLKLTLSLFVHTLEFIESGEVDEHLKDEVDNLIADSKDAKKNLLNAEHADQQRERAYKMDEGLDTSERLRINRGDAYDENAGNVHSTSASASTDVDAYDVEETDSNENKQLQLYDPQANLSLMQNISDDHFLLIAEHLRVQRLVGSFVLVVSNPAAGFLASEHPLPTEQQASRSSPMHRRTDVDGNQNSNDLLSPDRQRPSSATPSGAPSIDSRNDGHISRQGSGERKASSEHVNRLEDNSEQIDAEGHGTRVHGRIPRDLIRFRFDMFSEDVWYPMVLFPDMQDMHESIMYAARQSGLNGLELAMIEDLEYTLLDAENQVILPRFWQDTVKAGTSITLRTNPSAHTREVFDLYRSSRDELRIRQIGNDKRMPIDHEQPATMVKFHTGFKRFFRK